MLTFPGKALAPISPSQFQEPGRTVPKAMALAWPGWALPPRGRI